MTTNSRNGVLPESAMTDATTLGSVERQGRTRRRRIRTPCVAAILAAVVLVQWEGSARMVSALETDPQPTKSQGLFSGIATVPEANLFTGAASTSIPIDVPPGRGALTPKVALQYTSGAGPSLYGHGWDLPLGRIQRSGKHGVLACNDEVSRNEFVLSVPGATIECFLQPEASGVRVCRPKIQGSFVRIHYVPASKSWEAWDPSGLHYVFGDTEDARIGSNVGTVAESLFSSEANGCRYMHSWALTKIDDTVGNTVAISWLKEENVLRPDSIAYGGKEARGTRAGTSVHLFTVSFSWKSRPDAIVDGRAGVLSRLNHLIDEIVVKYGTAIVRRYEFNHDIDPGGSPREGRQSFLQSVTMYGKGGITALAQSGPGGTPASTVFSYNGGKSTDVVGFAPGTDFDAGATSLRLDRTTMSRNRSTADLVDMNGDGFPDIVNTEACGSDGNQDRQWVVRFGSPTGWGAEQMWDTVPEGVLPQDLKACSLRYVSIGGDISVTHSGLVDMNGDGIPDLVDAELPQWRTYLGRVRADGTGYFESVARTNWRDPSPTGVCFPDACEEDDPETQPNEQSKWFGLSGIGLTRQSQASSKDQTGLIDWNADGLVDFVDARYDRVHINSGEGFDPSGVEVGFPDIFFRRKDMDQDRVEEAIADLNGDGLPDFVRLHSGGSWGPGTATGWDVYFNAGGVLAAPVWWAVPEGCNGRGIQKEDKPYIYTPTVVRDLIDVNGDGLADIVEECWGPHVLESPPPSVFLNNGAGFSSSSRPLQLPAQPEATGFDTGRCESAEQCADRFIADVNGDGYVDLLSGGYVYLNVAGGRIPSWGGQDPGPDPWNDPGSPFYNEDWWRYALHPYSEPNLSAAPSGYLVHIENGIGGATDLAYRPSDPADSVENGIPQMPLVVWTVTGIVRSGGMTNTPGSDSLSTTIRYQGGKFDRAEREFRGFGTVYSVDGLGTQHTTTFYQDAARNGRVFETAVHPPGVDPSEGAFAFQVTRDEWTCAVRTSGSRNGDCPESLAGNATAWVRLSKKHTWDRGNGGPAAKHSWVTNQRWDPYGNVTETSSEADDTAPVLTVSTFAYDTSPARYIVNRPVYVKVTTNRRLLEERYIGYDGLAYSAGGGLAGFSGGGLVTSIHTRISPVPEIGSFPECPAGGGACTRTETDYDGWGNPSTVREYLTDGDYIPSSTTYDGLHLYPATSVNARGHVVRTYFDVACGKETERSLPNTTTFSVTTYDAFCRTETIRGPQHLEDYPAQRFLYFLGRRGVASEIRTLTATGDFVSEPWNERNDLFDGLGRPLQSYRTASVDGDRTTVVEGSITYDAQGNAVATSVPVEAERVLQDGVVAYQAIAAAQTTVAYDALGRVLETVAPDSSRTSADYSVPWETTAYDPCFHAPNCFGAKVVTRRDGHGRTIESRQYEEGSSEVKTATLFELDPAGKLLSSVQWKDGAYAEATRVTYGYDTLGREIERNDPDSGTWRSYYDALGRLRLHDDPKPNQFIELCYDELSRTTSKHQRTGEPSLAQGCSFNEATDSRYFYDSGAGVYSTGHLIRTEYPAGESVVREIDNAGRVTRSTSTVEVYGEYVQATFASTFDYDGKLRTVTYPDGEQIYFDYDTANALNFVKSLGDDQILLMDQTYDVHGRVKSVLHGNAPNGVGVRDDYEYAGADKLFRLTGLRVTPRLYASGVPECGGKLLDLGYEYRAGGKIKAVTDGMSQTFATVCGSLSNAAQYEYDGLGRLRRITGNLNLEDTFDFDSIGNIKSVGGRTLEYAADKPHQLATINGSSQGISHDENGNRKGKAGWTYEYDGENRLKSINQGATASMEYDPGGTQVRKRTSDGMTLYFGPLAEYSNANGRWVLTKYYFAGGRRLAMREVYDWQPELGLVGSAGIGSSLRYVAHAAVDGADEIAATILVAGLIGLALIRTREDQRRLGVVVRQGHAAGLVLVVVVAGIPYPRLGIGTAWAAGYAGSPPPTPIVVAPMSQPLHFHQDHLGSPQVITDANGNAVEHLRYTAHGVVRLRYNGALVSAGDGVQTRGFTGYEADKESGLYYAQARFYDPTLGGFLTHDPVRSIGSPYLYTGGDPMNLIDPTGTTGVDIAAFLIVAAIGAAAGAVASGVQAAIQGASFGQAMEAALVGAALGAVTAPISYGILSGWAIPAIATATGIAETTISGVIFAAGVGQAMYGMANGDYSGIIGLGVSIGMGMALGSGGGTEAGGGRDAYQVAQVGEGTVLAPSRRDCLLAGGGCTFDVASNPRANGNAPLIERHSQSQVRKYAAEIDTVARETGVDSRLIRAVMYVETTHGWYDALPAYFDMNRSILPMNINTDYWGDAWGSRAELKVPINNIRAGARMLNAIRSNLPAGASVAQVATIYNNLQAVRVSDYGARVAQVYAAKSW